jgi:hypothetical protein
MMRDGMALPPLAGLPWIIDGPASAVMGSRSHVKTKREEAAPFQTPKRIFRQRESSVLDSRRGASSFFPSRGPLSFPSFFIGCHIPIHVHADKLDDVQRSLFSPSLLT